MKTSAFTFLLLLFATANFAFTSTAGECRTALTWLAVSNDQMKVVEADFVSGRWTEKPDTGSARTFHFEAGGALSIRYSEASGKATHENWHWNLEEQPGHVLLNLSRPLGGGEQFLVKLTCEGATLTDVKTLQDYFLHFEPLVNEAKLTCTKATLTGDWTNVTQGPPARLLRAMKLRCDGTFRMTNAQGLEENGTWEVSKDGKNLLLFRNDPQAAGVLHTTMLHIVTLDEHGLTVEMPVDATGRTASVTFIQ